jgi:hypothetical protein
LEQAPGGDELQSRLVNRIGPADVVTLGLSRTAYL